MPKFKPGDFLTNGRGGIVILYVGAGYTFKWLWHELDDVFGQFDKKYNISHMPSLTLKDKIESIDFNYIEDNYTYMSDEEKARLL